MQHCLEVSVGGTKHHGAIGLKRKLGCSTVRRTQWERKINALNCNGP